jgi:hypothetical protein
MTFCHLHPRAKERPYMIVDDMVARFLLRPQLLTRS